MEQHEFLNSLRKYETMSQLVKQCSYEEILEHAADLVQFSPKQLASYNMGGYSKGRTSGAYEFVLKDLQKNIAHYDWLYYRLEDDISRMVFANLVGFRLLPVGSFLEAAYNGGGTPQYFDKHFVSCDDNEVFVDCGGFTGDTVEAYIREFGQYKHIYVYEPSGDNIQSCRDNLSGYPNVTVRQCGVGEKHAYLSMSESKDSSTFMEGEQKENGEGIEIISLDNDIKEKITFLKMDIEGFEIPALLGAKRHIREDFPKLAICTYHIISDMWEIPRLIDAIHPGYRFYMRHYDSSRNWETVLYAIPPEPVKPPARKERPRVASIMALGYWEDFQLVKECCAFPYLMHKNHGCDAYIVGVDPHMEYTRAIYVEGEVELVPLPDSELQTKLAYIQQNAGQIDALILDGPYEQYFSMVELYKYINPYGKVYLSLDANLGWMDRIQWKDPAFRHFMDQCDVIGAAIHTIQNHLNVKWPWKIEYFSNGFYNFVGCPIDWSFEQKKNVILTVGRLGVPQKANHILVEAFAQIAPDIPDWELRLVGGGITPEFEIYLSEFRERHPELNERIHVIANMPDKAELYREYAQAKIFSLTSTFEGWPNTFAEAMTMGDAIAITKFDSWRDAIDNGRNGMAAEINDVSGFANILLQMCTGGQLEKMGRNAYKYARENLDMEKIAARLYDRLFGGEDQHEHTEI